MALLLLAGCHRQPTDARTAEEAMQIANSYRTEHFPRAGPGRVEAEDLGDKWRVAYFRDGGGTGGVATYLVDKASGNIISEGSVQ